MFSQKKYNVLVTGGAGFLGKSNMSPIKRFLKYLAVISGSLMLFLIVALWILAVAFQTQVKRELTGYIRSHTGAEITFNHARLSFLRSFPKVHLEITDIVLFDRDKEAMKIGSFTVLFNPRKIIGDSLEVEQVVIRDATLNLTTDEQGNRTQLFSSHEANPDKPGKLLALASQELQLINFTFRSENLAKKNLTSFKVTRGRFIVGINKPVTRITGEIEGKLDSLISMGTLILSNLAVSSDNLIYILNDETRTQTLEQGNILVEGLKLVPSFNLTQQEDGQLIDMTIRCENDLNAFLSIFNMKAGNDLKQVNPEAKAILVFRQKGIVSAFQNPYTELDFAIREAQLESKKLPFAVNELFITGNYNNGKEHSAQSACIRIDTLHARIEDSFIEGKIEVKDLKDPQISAKLSSKIELQHIFKPTDQLTANGIITANLDIKGKLSEFEKYGITEKDLASGEIHLQDLDIYLLDSLYRIQVDTGRLNLKNQLLTINRFYGTLNKDTFYIEAKFTNFDQLIHKQKIEGEINAGFDRIDLGGFMAGYKSDTASGRFMEFLRGNIPMAVNAHITIDTLMAGGMACYNISGNVSISDGKTEIESFTCNYAGGKVSLEGVFRSNEDNGVTGNVISGATGVDMKQLLNSFGNFGQSFLTDDDISGKVSWTADLYFRLDSIFKPIDEENFWKFDFTITDSQLSNVVPIEKALSFIRQKSKDNILISTLDFSTYFVREKLYIQDVTIKNSISDMNIFGTYSPKDTVADLVLELSLSELLFKTLKKRMIETEDGLMDAGKDNNLNLRFTGTIRQHKVKPVIPKEYIKQKEIIQNQFNLFDEELKKRISAISSGNYSN